QTCAEAARHLDQCKAVGEKLGVCFLGMGMWPDKTRAELPVMPKGRYRIMLNYMPKVGTLGLDMMLRTCTIQTNLDYESEADMVRKFRVGLALQPLATALFANSPFTEGKPNGFLSFRSHIWSDTDPDRTGMLPFVFEDGFGYERYLDYALDVPMYFVYRDGIYHDVAGKSFRDFLDGRLAGFVGEKPRVSDFTDHLSTIFPEVRLKSFLEMRGAAGGRWGKICAPPAACRPSACSTCTMANGRAISAASTRSRASDERSPFPRPPHSLSGDRALPDRAARCRRWPCPLLGAMRQSQRQAGGDAAWRPRRRLQPRASPPVRSGAVQRHPVRPARLRPLDAACQPRGQHHLAPGRRYRAAARSCRRRRMVGVRRLL